MWTALLAFCPSMHSSLEHCFHSTPSTPHSLNLFILVLGLVYGLVPRCIFVEEPSRQEPQRFSSHGSSIRAVYWHCPCETARTVAASSAGQSCLIKNFQSVQPNSTFLLQISQFFTEQLYPRKPGSFPIGVYPLFCWQFFFLKSFEHSKRNKISWF